MSGYQIFRALDPATEAALRSSIRRHGVLVPVVLDQHDQIIDGHHRVRIAHELGVDYSVDRQDVTDEDHGRELAATLNADRRQVGIDERLQVVADLRAQGHSLRAIGGALGVSHTQVRNDLDRTGNHFPVEPDRIVGLDGKSRPARHIKAGDADEPDQWDEDDGAEDAHWLAKGRIPPGYERVEPQEPDAPDEPTGRQLDVMYSSATDDWATPPKFFDLLDAEFHFTLDVCASPDNAKCDAFFAEDDDGLAQPWTGTCWMNPPYGAAIADWMAKAHESAGRDCTVVCLVPARTDTGWWWNHARHGEVRFVRGRLHFGNAGAAPFPNAVVIFGRRPRVVWWEGWPA